MPLRYIRWMCSTPVILTSTLRGQSLLPDRPDVTESPYAVPSRNLQFEAGMSRNDERVTQAWQAMARFGIGGGREIRFLSGIHTPTELSLKQTIYEKDAFATGAILLIGYDEDVILRAVLPLEMGNGGYSAGINLIHEAALFDKNGGTSLITHSHALEVTKVIAVFAEGVHTIEDAFELEQLNIGGLSGG
jgi:hypothetical protein